MKSLVLMLLLAVAFVVIGCDEGRRGIRHDGGRDGGRPPAHRPAHK